MRRAPFATRPFPRERRDIVDALEVGVRRHMVHALLELDVTRARQLIRDREAAAGERLSFTAFIVASLARALDADRRLQAYRDWRGRLVLFDEVDVVTLVESEVDAVAIPHVIRAANRRTFREIHDEIRRVQAEPEASAQRSGLLARLSPSFRGSSGASFSAPCAGTRTGSSAPQARRSSRRSGCSGAARAGPWASSRSTRSASPSAGSPGSPGSSTTASRRGSTSRSPRASTTTWWTALPRRGSREHLRELVEGAVVLRDLAR